MYHILQKDAVLPGFQFIIWRIANIKNGNVGILKGKFFENTVDIMKIVKIDTGQIQIICPFAANNAVQYDGRRLLEAGIKDLKQLKVYILQG